MVWGLPKTSVKYLIIMPDSDALWKDIQKLDDLYEELLWHPDDELQFTHDGEKIIVINKTVESKKKDNDDFITYK